jgi:hypothetical protein
MGPALALEGAVGAAPGDAEGCSAPGAAGELLPVPHGGVVLLDPAPALRVRLVRLPALLH